MKAVLWFLALWVPGVALLANALPELQVPWVPRKAFRATIEPWPGGYVDVEKGIAKYYSPGMMGVVASHRRMQLRDDVFGYAAVADCGKIGSVVVAAVGTLTAQRYQVIDCSQPYDLPAHEREGLIIEVDYASAMRAGIVREGKGPAIIYAYQK